jgi:hypothetical protein
MRFWFWDFASMFFQILEVQRPTPDLLIASYRQFDALQLWWFAAAARQLLNDGMNELNSLSWNLFAFASGSPGSNEISTQGPFAILDVINLLNPTAHSLTFAHSFVFLFIVIFVMQLWIWAQEFPFWAIAGWVSGSISAMAGPKRFFWLILAPGSAQDGGVASRGVNVAGWWERRLVGPWRTDRYWQGHQGPSNYVSWGFLVCHSLPTQVTFTTPCLQMSPGPYLLGWRVHQGSLLRQEVWPQRPGKLRQWNSRVQHVGLTVTYVYVQYTVN